MANRRLRLVAWSLVLGFVVGYLSYLNRRFQLADALIYQRYFRNFLDGYGLVFNLGERVNALTSPLFSYLSIVVSSAVGSVALASVIISGTALFLALAVWWRVYANVLDPVSATVGVGVALLFPYLYVTFGMETCLFLLVLGLFRQVVCSLRPWPDFWLKVQTRISETELAPYKTANRAGDGYTSARR
jgi:arabinofuranosyltransferase